MKVIMYHYVRPINGSRYPKIKGREIHEFKSQIKFLQKDFHIVQPQDLLDSLENGLTIPENWVLLTFDDGYVDHFRYVFPLLHDYKLSGMFFPPQAVVEERSLLDVNKIHFILSSGIDPVSIYHDLIGFLKNYNYDSEKISYLHERYFHQSRFDSPEVMFIKNILQKGIPLNQRSQISKDLFNKIVSVDEKAFAEELYLSLNECRVMASCGMFFGSHGKSHYWLDTLNDKEQDIEIEESVLFLNKIYNNPLEPLENYVMCYPYGAYNDYTLNALRRNNFDLAFTTTVGDINFFTDDRLQLKRFDTNDFPC